MSAGGSTRRARVRALAKINLDLRVIGKRPDGFHELRTIFQTISLADTLDIAFTPAPKTSIELDDAAAIADNLVTRAARIAMDTMGATGRIEMRLTKRIPMGAGLGGGSSDAAAVLLALPVLARRRVEVPKLRALAEEIGSDVPFFLLGGTAVGIGRGTELFPLPDAPARHGIVVAPGVHIDTAQAYRELSPRLTTESQQNKMVSFQIQSWGLRLEAGSNDFEGVAFEQHGSLAVLKEKLLRVGAFPAMMTGSGSALFGLFPSAREAARAERHLAEERSFRISLVSRARYRSIWRRALEGHTTGTLWPPQSRNAR